MRRKLLISTLIIFSLLVFVVNTYAEKRVALIIGNSEYISDGYHPLSQPVNDAEAFDKALKSFGFENGSGIIENPMINHEEYIIPAKTKFRPVALESQFLNLNAIVKEMELRSKLSLIFYDACRNEPNAQIPITSRTKGGSFIGTYRNNQLMICYATAQGKTASAGDGTELSPFTEVIIDNIYKQEDFESLWYNSIRNDNRLSNQVPQNSGGIAGEFYFNKPALTLQDDIIERLSKTNVKTYNDDELFPKNLEGKWGFIDKTGYFVIPPNYNYAYHFSEGLARVLGPNDKWGYIDTSDNLIIQFKYSYGSDFSNGFATVNNDAYQEGCIDKTGKEFLPLIYKDVDIESNGIIIVENKYGKYGIFDYNGIQKVPFIYNYISRESGGLYAVKKGKKWGYIDKNGKVVIDFLYDGAQSFFRGLAKVDVGAPHYKYINRKGEIVR